MRVCEKRNHPECEKTHSFLGFFCRSDLMDMSLFTERERERDELPLILKETSSKV